MAALRVRKEREREKMSSNAFLVKRLIFYQSYHNNPYNKAIHVVCIPLIVWAVLVWLCAFQVDFPLPFALKKDASSTSASSSSSPSPATVPVDLARLVTTAYCTLYAYADRASGFTWGLFVGLPLYLAARAFFENYGGKEGQGQPFGGISTNVWALAAFVFGFYFQVHAGHYVFEKRKPALVDSFLEAMLAAPLFVWLEVIFVLGFKKDLQEHVEGEAAKLIAQYKKQQKAA